MVNAPTIDPRKCHMHALRHSMAVMLWNHTSGNIGFLQRHLGHKSASLSLIYLYESDGPQGIGCSR
jgi:integrase